MHLHETKDTTAWGCQCIGVFIFRKNCRPLYYILAVKTVIFTNMYVSECQSGLAKYGTSLYTFMKCIAL